MLTSLGASTMIRRLFLDPPRKTIFILSLIIRYSSGLTVSLSMLLPPISYVRRFIGNTVLLPSDNRAARPLEEYAAPSQKDSSLWLFASQRQKEHPLSRYQAYRIVKDAAAFAGLNANVSCHSLRKTFGYHAWKQGAQPALLMNIYNHSSYQITKRYLCIDQDDKDEVFAKIRL